MLVTRCDRCGEITEEPVKLSVQESRKEMRIAREYDLCKKCAEKLEEFLTEEETHE